MKVLNLQNQTGATRADIPDEKAAITCSRSQERTGKQCLDSSLHWSFSLLFCLFWYSGVWNVDLNLFNIQYFVIMYRQSSVKTNNIFWCVSFYLDLSKYIDSDHLCYIYLASFTSPARLIPGESILSSMSITVQAYAKDLSKIFKKLNLWCRSCFGSWSSWCWFVKRSNMAPQWSKVGMEVLIASSPNSVFQNSSGSQI